MVGEFGNGKGSKYNWAYNHPGSIKNNLLVLNEGERIVAVRGDKNYKWKCFYGYWQSLEFLIADDKGNERSHKAFKRPPNTVNKLPRGYNQKCKETGEESVSEQSDSESESENEQPTLQL